MKNVTTTKCLITALLSILAVAGFITPGFSQNSVTCTITNETVGPPLAIDISILSPNGFLAIEVLQESNATVASTPSLPVQDLSPIPNPFVVTATKTNQNLPAFVIFSGATGGETEFECRVDFPNVQPSAHDFVFLAEKKIKIIAADDSEGNIHSNTEIEFGKGQKDEYECNLSAVEEIRVQKFNEIEGTATAPEVDNSGEIDNIVIAAVAPVPLPSVASFSVNKDNIRLDKGERESIDPGTYGKIRLGQNARLTLSSGEYFFRSLKTGRGAELRIDVSNGPVIINVKKKIRLGTESRVRITPGDEDASDQVTFNTLSKSIKFGDDAKVLGTFIGPKAKAKLGKSVRFKGAICVKKILVQKDVVFLPHGSTTNLPKAAFVADASLDDAFNSLPQEFELGQNYPNPFNPSTTINFAVPEAANVTLAIYNLRGQLVATLHQGALAAGRHRMVWDGKDARGQQAATGVYVYRLEAKDFVATRKLTLMK